MDWARQHDEEGARIAKQAADFAESHLSLEGSLYYFYRLLLRLATVVGPPSAVGSKNRSGGGTVGAVDADPDDAVAAAPAKDEPAGEAILCWAVGYTPEFCCN